MTYEFCWLALVPYLPEGAIAVATVPDTSTFLAAWHCEHPPARSAAKIDPRAIDPDGPPGRVSLVLAPEGAWLPFDDVAVSHAMRAVMRARPVDVVSTLLVGDDRFAGAMTAMHDEEDAALDDDPFAAIFPTVRLRLGPGLLGRTPTPVGPNIQRYGATNPWPWDRFE